MAVTFLFCNREGLILMNSFLKGMDFARSLNPSFLDMGIVLYGRKISRDTKVTFEGIDTKNQMVCINVKVPDYINW